MTAPNNPLRNKRHDHALIPFVDFPRRPTSADIRNPKNGQIYQRPYLWRVRLKEGGGAPDSGSEGELWYLEDITANVADWKQFTFAGSSPGIDTITGDDGVAVGPDGVGNLDFFGLAVANATNEKPLYFNGDAAAFSQTAEIQVAAAIASAPGDKNDAGICSFDSSAFEVDEDGFVTLKGGSGPAADSFNVDFNTAPGTNPVVPDDDGEITFTGSTVANGTNANAPLASHSRAANTIAYEIQVATEIAAAPGDKLDAGICSFLNTQFDVDEDGFVSLVGGGGAPTLGIVGDEGSGNVPDVNGDITITGDVVANATHSKPVYVDDAAVSASTIDVQITTTTDGTPVDFNDVGLASFYENHFEVDAYGNVSLLNPSPGAGTFFFFDDFIQENMYNYAGFAVASITGSAGRPGIAVLDANDGIDFDSQSIVVGGGEIRFEVQFRLGSATLDSSEAYRFGLVQGPLGSPYNYQNGIYFKCIQGTANWRCFTSASSTNTDSNSGVALTTDWTKFHFIVNAAGTSVAFYIDDSLVATNATNIPSAALFFEFERVNGGTNPDGNLDYVVIQADATRP